MKGKNLRGTDFSKIMSNNGFGMLDWEIKEPGTDNRIVFSFSQNHIYKTTSLDGSRVAGAVKKNILKKINGGYFDDNDRKWLEDRGVVIDGVAFVPEFEYVA